MKKHRKYQFKNVKITFSMYLNSVNLRYEGDKLIRYEGYTVWGVYANWVQTVSKFENSKLFKTFNKFIKNFSFLSTLKL